MTEAPSLNFTARTAALLGLILLVAAALRLWNIGRSSFWLDEFATVEISNGHGLDYEKIPGQILMTSPPDFVHLDHANSIASIWTDSARDLHPPLFYAMARLWRYVVPDTDAWMRTLPALLSLAAIVLLFLAVAAVGGTTAGLWAAMLMAVAGPQIQYAQENRMYTLLLATLLGSAASLLRIEKFGFTWPRVAALCACTLAAALSHYSALPIAALLGLYSLIRLRGTARKGALAAIFAAAILFGAIWGPFAWRQTSSISQIGFTQLDPTVTKLSELRALLLLPLWFFATTQKQTTEIGFLGAVLYFLPLLLMRRRPELLFWWMWLAVGVGGVVLSDLMRGAHGIYWIRYTLAASPAAYALAAMMLSHLSGWTRHLVPMTLALSSVLALEGAYDTSKPPWRDMARYIDNHLQPGDVLIIGDLDPAHWPSRSEMVALSFYVHTASIATAIMDQPPSPELREQLMSARRIWIFTDGMRSAMTRIFPMSRTTEGTFIAGVGNIYRVEFPPFDVAPLPVNAPAAQPNPPSTAPEPVALH